MVCKPSCFTYMEIRYGEVLAFQQYHSSYSHCMRDATSFGRGSQLLEKDELSSRFVTSSISSLIVEPSALAQLRDLPWELLLPMADD